MCPPVHRSGWAHDATVSLSTDLMAALRSDDQLQDIIKFALHRRTAAAGAAAARAGRANIRHVRLARALTAWLNVLEAIISLPLDIGT